MAGRASDPFAVIDIPANSLIPVFAGLAAGYVADVRNVTLAGWIIVLGQLH